MYAPRVAVVVLVTGAPASGKTTIARRIARELGLPYLGKDLIKEELFDTLGWSNREWSKRLGLASMQLLYRVATAMLDADQSMVLEANFYARWDTSKLQSLGQTYACQFVQIVCRAPGPVLVERYKRRMLSGERHPGHTDPSFFDEIHARLLDEKWDALDLPGPVVNVDTTTVVDFDGLLRYVSRQVSLSPG